MRLLASILGVLGAAALAVGAVDIADETLAGRQLDLTQQRLYTLSPGTRQVLAGLREPITLRLYYSSALGARVAEYGAHAARVRELLREYAELAHGRIHLEFHDPEPFSDSEDRATGYGLQSVPLEQGGPRVFFGLEGNNLLDDERSIAFFQPERERFLEYDLTHLIQDLARRHRPVLGVMTALKLDGDPQAMLRHTPGSGPTAAMLALRQAFTVKTVATDAQAFDPDIAVLMVVHPQNLGEKTLYAIDQFVMHGGKLMALVAPTNETLTPDPKTGVLPPQASDLGRLFKAWGIAYDPDQAVGDLTGAWKVKAGQGDQPVDYVAYFSVRDGINHDDPATAALAEIALADAGSIALAPGSPLQMTPLLTSSTHSALLPAAALRTDPDPQRLLDGFHPDGQRRVIAARLRGPLPSAFAGPLNNDTQFLAHTKTPANLVVIADTDFLADRFWTRTQDFFGTPTATPFADNGTFVTNLASTLAGGDALLGLRGRGGASHPFEVVDRMQRDAEARYRRTATALTAHMDATTRQLDALRSGRDGSNNAALDAAQQKAVAGLKRDLLDTRQKLRAVQLDLRRDIAALETKLRLFDIGLVPAILLLLAVLMGAARSFRRRRGPA